MLARLIDKPSPGRNFVFSFFIISLAIGFVTEMAQEDSIWIGVFRLDFAGLIIFASLLGICTEVVLITIYRGNSIAAIISGLLTGITAFFMAYLFPPEELIYQNFHDFPSLIRISATLIAGALSYVLACVWNDRDKSS